MWDPSHGGFLLVAERREKELQRIARITIERLTEELISEGHCFQYEVYLYP